MEKNDSTSPKETKKEFQVTDILPEGISIYLNMIGGHSFFVSYQKKYLFKRVKERELKFYEYLINNNIDSPHLLHCYGFIKQGTKQHDYIVNYKNKCDNYIKRLIKLFDIKLDDVNIQHDIMFEQKFRDFTNEKNNVHNCEELDNSFNDLKDQLIYIRDNNINKFFWIFYWYIKWEQQFVNDNFIILDNLDYNKEEPTTIDIKVGEEKKISKKSSKAKIYKGAHESFGCRIMGIYKKNLKFKSRFVTKIYDAKEFMEELNTYFEQRQHIIDTVIKIIEDIIDFVEDKLYLKIYFASILISYDNINDKKEPSVKLIDFELTNCSNTNNYEIYPVKGKEAETDYNAKFISALTKLIKALKSLK